MRFFTEEDFSDEIIRDAIQAFKQPGIGRRGQFYQKSSSWTFDINDTALFRNAVWQGYLDACRTFTNIDTHNERSAFENLADKIQSYFRDDGAIFAHEDWCDGFLDDLKKYNNYSYARYGQAQKVINMAFKYLYCCSGAELYKEKFEPCHMPLDQYTLTWLFYEQGVLYQEWSWFDKNTYQTVMTIIKSIVGPDILGKELVIWKRFTEAKNPVIINLKKNMERQDD